MVQVSPATIHQLDGRSGGHPVTQCSAAWCGSRYDEVSSTAFEVCRVTLDIDNGVGGSVMLVCDLDTRHQDQAGLGAVPEGVWGSFGHHDPHGFVWLPCPADHGHGV